MADVPPKGQDKGASPAPTTAKAKASKSPGASDAPPQVPAVYEQTSRMHKVMAAVEFEDEFSNRSLKAESWKKAPVELKPEPRREETEGGGRLLRFFRGFIR